MKIHSDVLTYRDIHASIPDTCYVEWFAVAGSKQRERAWDVRISGSSKYNMSGLPAKAATWDEWGYFLRDLFKIDPNAICGRYKGVEDFNKKTENAFIPA